VIEGRLTLPRAHDAQACPALRREGHPGSPACAKHAAAFVCAAALVLACAATLKAQDEGSRSFDLKGTVKLYGSVYTEDDASDRYDPHEALDYAINRGELHLKLDGYVSEKVSYKSHLAFTYGMRHDVRDLSQLEVQESGTEQETDLSTELKAASITVMDLGTAGVDLTVGRQRIRWGTSDEYNVIDNLNPVDYGNVFSFDPDYFVEHLPMDGFNLEYRLPTEWELKAQFVYLLSFRPASLPEGFKERITDLMEDELEEQTAPYGFPTGEVSVDLDSSPEYWAGKGTVGVRVGGNAFNMDWGVSYFHGYAGLPLIHAISSDITLVEGTTLNALMSYPRLDVLGFDLAGEVRSVGVWAEAGCYWPEDYVVRRTAKLMSTTRTDVIRLFDRPYWKYTLGFDYTFGIGSGLYWNVQFNHGFYDEFRYTPEAGSELGLGRPGFMGGIEDYLATRVEYKFFHDELTTVLDCLLEMPDKSDVNGYSAVVVKPKLIYKPYDSTSFELAYVLITGDSRTKYGAFEKNDVVYLLTKVYF